MKVINIHRMLLDTDFMNGIICAACAIAYWNISLISVTRLKLIVGALTITEDVQYQRLWRKIHVRSLSDYLSLGSLSEELFGICETSKFGRVGTD